MERTVEVYLIRTEEWYRGRRKEVKTSRCGRTIKGTCENGRIMRET